MKINWAAFAPLAGAVLFVLSGQVSLAGEKIVLTGSSTIAPLLTEIGKRYEERNPGVRVDVQSGGSSRGISDTRAGLADIGMVSRALNNDEADLRSYEVARDGIGVIVHRDNKIRALSSAQIVGIYTGTARDWSAVGGSTGQITVVNKAEGRSTLELFLHHFKLKARDIKASVVIGDNQQGIKTVAGNAGAIGYVSIGTAEYEQSVGAPIRLLGIGGIAASVENVRNGSYPLARPLNLVTKAYSTSRVKDFVAFAQSAPVRDLIEEQFFVAAGP